VRESSGTIVLKEFGDHLEHALRIRIEIAASLT